MANLIVPMRRKALSELSCCDHAGLLLDRGFDTWAKEADVQRNIKQHNEAAHELHKQAANISKHRFYKQAYERWQNQQIQNGNNSQVWFGKLENRMFLGMGISNPIESGITLHHTYGVPYIPGSAIKGVLHHYAEGLGLSETERNILFGEEASATKKEHTGSAGYIIYNDAWWIPEGKALAPEMITVHAPKYYASKGSDAPHPDFESPNPNPQIAIQGSFMFSVEGEENWANYAIKLLSQCMKDKGIGGKTASGYGYFLENENAKKKYLKDSEKIRQEYEKSKIIEAYEKLPLHEKLVCNFEKNIEHVKGKTITKDNYVSLNSDATAFMRAVKDQAAHYSVEQKDKIKSMLETYYDAIGWGMPGKASAKKKKQKVKKEESINKLF
jgi:CRISPR-associated protein Cmr6